jgi:hypothetical protein
VCCGSGRLLPCTLSFVSQCSSVLQHLSFMALLNYAQGDTPNLFLLQLQHQSFLSHVENLRHWCVLTNVIWPPSNLSMRPKFLFFFLYLLFFLNSFQVNIYCLFYLVQIISNLSLQVHICSSFCACRFAHPYSAFFMFVPASLVGLLLPRFIWVFFLLITC